MSDDEVQKPSRYYLQTLLDMGVQPLPDLAPDEFEALRKAIARRPLADPLTVSSDGVLLDGHQRARAMLANGRKFIEANEVHVVAAANASNAFEYAVQLNVTRRQLTVEQKAELARKFQRERRWSQAKIAKLFGVSRPAVSQWLAKHPDTNDDEDFEPFVVSGMDGKTYVTEPARRKPPEQRNAWKSGGYAYHALARARNLVQREPVGGLDGFQTAKLRALAQDMIDSCMDLLEKLSREDSETDDDLESKL
jgi:ParB-like chromosome segregation protein Spo0J